MRFDPAFIDSGLTDAGVLGIASDPARSPAACSSVCATTSDAKLNWTAPEKLFLSGAFCLCSQKYPPRGPGQDTRANSSCFQSHLNANGNSCSSALFFPHPSQHSIHFKNPRHEGTQLAFRVDTQKTVELPEMLAGL